MRLELGVGRRCCLLSRPRQLLTQARDRGALLLVGRAQPLGLRRHTSLCRNDQLPLPLRELLQLGREGLLGAVEVGAPGREALLDLRLDPRELSSTSFARARLFAFAGHSAAILREAPLIVLEGRHGIRPCSCERVLELLGALAELLSTTASSSCLTRSSWSSIARPRIRPRRRMRAPIATSTQAVRPAAAIAPDRLGSSAKATQAEVAADASTSDDRDDRARSAARAPPGRASPQRPRFPPRMPARTRFRQPSPRS